MRSPMPRGGVFTARSNAASSCAVRDEPQVRERVLDLGAIEVAQAAVHAVRDVVLDQLLFEVARLRVRAVQDRDVARLAARPRCTRGCGRSRSALRPARCTRRRARSACRPRRSVQSSLPSRSRVVRDDRVRGGEDVAGGAVVLLEADRLRAGKIAQEMLHVLDARAAPAVDRLIVVADDEHLSGRRRRARGSTRTEACWCPGIRRSGDGGSARGSARSNASLCSQSSCARNSSSAKSTSPRAGTRLRRRDRYRSACASTGLCLASSASGRLPSSFALLMNQVACRGGKRASSSPSALDRALDEALLVVRSRGSGTFPADAPRASAGAAGGARCRGTCRSVSPRTSLGDQRLGARAHFAGGLVGERDREHRPRRHALDLEQPADAVRQHARLAGAGAGEHQVMPRRRGVTASRCAGLRSSSKCETSIAQL